MPYILSAGIKQADYSYTQEEIKNHIKDLFSVNHKEMKRLLPIFDHSLISRRQFSKNLSWYEKNHGLKERNEVYVASALRYAKCAVESCMNEMKSKDIYTSIDHIIYVSSTGIATPTIDCFIINQYSFKESIVRTPLFGLGCAGGTSGVARAVEWLKGHPGKNVLVVCVELCSLTFQKSDNRISNFVGTALFGDGASAVLVAGDESSLLASAFPRKIKVEHTSSRIKKNSIEVMGWNIIDTGFEVVFNKSIPGLVKSFWKEHAENFLGTLNLTSEDIDFVVAHPGGKKVLEGYQTCLGLKEGSLHFSQKVLKDHGNMSSSTVHFVLHEVMKSNPKPGTHSFMTSLGPGFSSEMVSLEWV